MIHMHLQEYKKRDFASLLIKIKKAICEEIDNAKFYIIINKTRDE